MSHFKEERNKEIIRMYKDGYDCKDIAGMVNLSRQRVHAIIHNYYWGDGKENVQTLTEFQRDKISEVVFPNIRKFLLDKRIGLIKFCESVDREEAKTCVGVSNFLTGKKKSVSIDVINNIILTTNMPYNVAFSYEELTE